MIYVIKYACFWMRAIDQLWIYVNNGNNKRKMNDIWLFLTDFRVNQKKSYVAKSILFL